MESDLLVSDKSESLAKRSRLSISVTESIILVVAFVVAVGGGAYWYLSHSPFGLRGVVYEEVEEQADLTGHFYYTVGPGSALEGTYYSDLVTKERGGAPFLKAATAFYPSIVDTTVAAFFRNAEGAFSVKVVEPSSNTTLVERALESVRLGSVALNHNHSLVAYATSPTSFTKGEALQLSPWNVNMIPVQGGGASVQFQGVSPIFSSDDKYLFYLGKDGVYKVALQVANAKVPKRVWDLDAGIPGSFMRLATATDAPVVAFSNAYAFKRKGIVEVFSTDETGEWKKLTTFYHAADDIALSPDGKYVALHIHSVDGKNLPGAGKIIVYSVASGKTVRVSSLEAFAPNLQLVAWTEGK